MTDNHSELRYAGSYKQAAAILHCEVEALKQAKDSGCKAFRGSRIYVDEYREWLKTSPPTPENTEGNGTKESWEIARIKKWCRKFDLEYDQAKSELIEKKELIDLMPKLLQPAIEIAQKYLPLEQYNAFCREIQDGLHKLAS